MVGEGDSGLGVPHLFPCRTWGRCGGGKGGAATAQGIPEEMVPVDPRSGNGLKRQVDEENPLKAGKCTDSVCLGECVYLWC